MVSGAKPIFDAERDHVGAQRLGDHLSAETHPEGWPPLRQALFDQRQFMVEKIIAQRTGKVLGSADRPAEHHQQIGVFIIDSTNIIAAGIVIVDLIATQREQGTEDAQVFKIDVSNGDGFFIV